MREVEAVGFSDLAVPAFVSPDRQNLCHGQSMGETFASRLPTALHLVAHIVGVGPFEQMRVIAAGRVVAAVP